MDQTQVCIGCLCLHILRWFVSGYNKRFCILLAGEVVYLMFLGRKNGVDFYEKLDNKRIFLAYKELSCSENLTEVFVIILVMI